MSQTISPPSLLRSSSDLQNKKTLGASEEDASPSRLASSRTLAPTVSSPSTVSSTSSLLTLSLPSIRPPAPPSLPNSVVLPLAPLNPQAALATTQEIAQTFLANHVTASSISSTLSKISGRLEKPLDEKPSRQPDSKTEA